MSGTKMLSPATRVGAASAQDAALQARGLALCLQCREQDRPVSTGVLQATLGQCAVGTGALQSLLPRWMALVEVTVSLRFRFLIGRARIVRPLCKTIAAMPLGGRRGSGNPGG